MKEGQHQRGWRRGASRHAAHCAALKTVPSMYPGRKHSLRPKTATRVMLGEQTDRPMFCSWLAADPFASLTSTRAVRVTPLRNPQLRMNLQGRAPQESATADEPPLQRGLTTSCPWSWPLGTAPQLRLQRPCPCRCPCWRPFPSKLCPPQERSGELPAPTSAGQCASA